ncbi:MAG: thiamine-phosphate kinase [Beijerinckiaceae bacterium]
MSQPSDEDRFIGRWFAPLAGPGALGLRDDAALLTPPEGRDLVLTVDTLVAGVHFYAEDPADTIARKALRVNLSDLAAKGADPAGFLLSFAMPADKASPVRSEGWLASFAGALGEDAKSFSCPLLGGDTVTTPGPLTLSVTAFGSLPRGTMARRTGAHAGDVIFVSGTIGDAALGVHLAGASPPSWAAALAQEHRAFLVERYRVPQPRNALAAAVRQFAHGAMDVSDGLAGDLAKMMRVSGVSARVEIARVPRSDAASAVAAADAGALNAILTGGDDYEILCTVARERAIEFSAAARAAGVAVTAIGEVAAQQEREAVFVDEAGKTHDFARGSYSHF